uniref:Hypothetical soluble protein n=1 Tax=Rubrivivax gelatinosus TaxID=28068 RepID=Q9JPC5_RUBGE|nr:hypothetical soluble protein [Rubrivivax gelatinosus IL144]
MTVFRSASLMRAGGVGVIGTLPKTPTLPLRTRSAIVAGAPAWPLYFLAIS